MPAKVASIEYDPNRTAASRCSTTPTARSATSSPRRAQGRRHGAVVAQRRHQAGQLLPLRFIPLGTTIHNVELKIGGGAQLCRSAGVGAQLMAKEGDWGQVRLPSGEMRLVHLDCRATIGQVGNIEHANIHVGKAGRTRWMGQRPHNRGVTMNPVDHPMGGGEGRSLGRPSPLLAVGPADQGLQDAQEQAHRRMIVKRRGKKA